MQCRILLAFVVSLLTVAVTAAPVPESSEVLKRIEHAPIVGISDVAHSTAASRPNSRPSESRSPFLRLVFASLVYPTFHPCLHCTDLRATHLYP
ncbi:hypothetical protein MSAN_02069200 [Mycena sanguinolenta]|uniref:Uncharacterized protein n=1 Tax=Mycena sanguinolenta TaxID=230812 RepID=A0A8H6XI88_9AGAR|nr:hypothetical protein MSAN_02069200 [Mycena sanguinolenta]